MEMTGADALAHQLVAEGVTDLFGIPGVQLDYAVDALAKVSDSLSFRNGRHEQAVSYMADGYARTGDKPGVCMVVPGPGLLNAMAGLATAYACSSRVLCIAGQIPSKAIGAGLGMLHEVPDQSHTLGTVTKWQGIARTPAEVPGLVSEALRQVKSGRPRPVGIEIPPDVLQASAEMPEVALSGPGELTAPDPAMVEQAARVLTSAHRPVVYAGGGVQAGRAWKELRELAEALQAPVIMTSNARGSLSDRHPLAIGALGGREVLPQADAVLAVGTRFIGGGPGGAVKTAEGAKVVLLNAEAADLGAPRTSDVAILADAKLGLAALRAALEGSAARETWIDLDAIRAGCAKRVAEIEPQAGWMNALRAAIPDDGILVNELTQVGYLSQVGYPVYEPRTFISPGYQGTLGYGFPTALGAKVANPDRAVVSISGDGGFGWNLQELATARKYSIPLVTVVFNDGAFGNVQRTQRERFDGRVLGTELVNPDYPALAAAFGITGKRVGSPAELQGTLTEALAGSEPVLVEVPVGQMPSAWHLIHDFIPDPKRAKS